MYILVTQVDYLRAYSRWCKQHQPFEAVYNPLSLYTTFEGTCGIKYTSRARGSDPSMLFEVCSEKKFVHACLKYSLSWELAHEE